MWPLLLIFGVALTGAAAITPVVRKLSWHFGFLDQPASRKVHRKATPLLGGAAVGLGMLLGVLGASAGGFAGPPAAMPAGWGTALGLLVALGVGLWDDRRGMNPGPKLVWQVVTALCFVADGLTSPLTPWPPLNVVLTVAGIVALMNAMNFLDNMDGIAAGIGMVAGLTFAVLGLWLKQPAQMYLGAALSGGCAGFLFFNFSPASIFLGDAGSLLVGAALGRLALGTVRAGGGGAIGVLPTMLVLLYPLFDISFVTIVRRREGRRVSQGGRDHTTHRLNTLLKSHRLTALTVYALCLLLAGTALAVARAGNGSAAALAGAAAAVFFVVLGLGLGRVQTA